jgi:hypothetical protein
MAPYHVLAGEVVPGVRQARCWQAYDRTVYCFNCTTRTRNLSFF